MCVRRKKKCSANRVGVRTTAKIPKGSRAQDCRIGTAKATVFPEPVREPPIQSLPVGLSV